MFLVNCVFVPCQKGAVLTKMAKMTNLHSTPLKTRASLLRPLKTTKMAGVTQEKAWFRKSRVWFFPEKPCPSFPWLFCFTKENLQNYQGFSVPAERIETLENKRKHPFEQGNSLLKINQGNPNNQGKEGQGMSLFHSLSLVPP